MRTRLTVSLVCLLFLAAWSYPTFSLSTMSANLLAMVVPTDEAPPSDTQAHPPGLFAMDSDITGDASALDLPAQVTVPPPPTATASPTTLPTETPRPTERPSFAPTQLPPTRTPPPPAPTSTQPAAVPQSVQAPSGLASLVARVKTGRPGVIVGVYSPGVLSLRVVIQPWGDPNWVSDEAGTATLFTAAAREGKGTVGLLAHNGRAGASFPQVGLGQEVDIVLGDGAVLPFRVSEVERYQALAPNDPSSPLKDLATGQIWSSDDAFNRVYGRDGSRVVLQTCIKAGDEWSWGRIFVIATR